ncbi:amino acid adenylation domain-containing protein [Paenibacillus sp. sgz500958]|uniref:amino acid adenylation domain-containing protein n=1 Tax=Paenibacillus sp. sgz500958 TaxID=3242475 RepID=UPI0036D4039A
MSTNTIGEIKEGESFVFPASDAQKRLWYLDELIANNPAYYLSFPMRMIGPFNVTAFINSLNELVRRHESFRTWFSYEEEELVQVVTPACTLEVPLYVEEGLSQQARSARALALAKEESLRPFDLSQGPLIRASVVMFDDEDYVALLTFHHIITDGWSMNVMFSELEDIYAAFCQGKRHGLPEPELQYGDYSVWQKEWLKSEGYRSQIEYWRNRLKGHRSLLDLPVDRPRHAVQLGHGGSFEFLIPDSVTATMNEIGQTLNATSFMVYLAAFQVFMHRYSGQDDLCIGVLNANRNQPGLEEVIGCFVNTLVHRAQHKHGQSFREVLSVVVADCLDMLSNAEVPFDKIVDEVGEKRNVHHLPLIQVLFECINEDSLQEQLSLPGVSITSIDTPTETAKFDLSLYIRQQSGKVYGKFEYNADLWEQGTIMRMAEHFVALLEGIACAPDQPAEQISLLSKSEWQTFMQHTQEELADGNECECIHKRFEEQAERTPDAVAVEADDGCYTYRELNEQANRLAHFLRNKGVRTEDMIVLCMERSAKMIVAILGVLKAGAAYVPVDPAAPAERIRFILEDAAASLILTLNSPLQDTSNGCEIIDLDNIYVELSLSPADNLAVKVEPSNLAYVIYTSGSTGKPKGVMIEHANVYRLFTETEPLFGFDEQDVWTLFHSYAFDFSVWEIWGALFYGGRLIIVPHWVCRSPESFYQLLVERKVTVLNQTPSNFRQVIQVDQRLKSEMSLRYVIFGGEALDYRVLRSWFERRGDSHPKLVNMYGITETTVHVTHRVIQANDSIEGKGSLIGTPIRDLQVYILDDLLQPVPTGIYGEMYVEGAGLARGYLNRKELTTERFIVHPYSEDSGRRLYKTGDVARRLPDGELEFRGRADKQVKIRGFRIELGEIEAVLLQHPQVAGTVVALKAFPGGGQGLVGYVVPASPEAELGTEEVRNFLAQQLPDYMVVSQVITIAGIPLTINGKVDVDSLPEPNFEHSNGAGRYVEPATEDEVLMSRIWAKVLQLDRVGVTDNYFELGGDSIRSLQILYQAREAGLNFHMQDLFKHPTVRGLVQVHVPTVVKQELATPWPVEPIQVPEEYEDIFPMAQSQLGMLYHSKLNSKTSVYHNVHTFRIRAPYSKPAWESAVEALIARHPILRTSFELTRFSAPMQIVHKKVDVPLSFYDVSGTSIGEQEVLLEQFIQKERGKPFHWEAAPLIRFSVHKLDQETFQLGITEHHAILDGWSVATLQVELFNLYFQSMGLAEEPLPETPAVTYKDFICLEQEAIHSSESRTFWKRQLGSIDCNKLPRIQEDSKSRETDMQSDTIDIPVALSPRLLGLAQRLQVPIKSVLLAAHLRVLSLVCNQTDVTTGLVFHGRPELQGSDRVLGMFLNTLPLRHKLQSGSWSQLICEVFELEQNIFAHRHYPLAQIQQDNGGLELFEVFFNFTNFHVLHEIQDRTHLEILDERSHAETSFTFGAEFNLDSLTSNLHLDLRWDNSQLLHTQVKQIGGYYLAVLSLMAEDENGSYTGRSFLSEEENHLLCMWNKTGRDYPVRCLHDLFQEQVLNTPDCIALHFEGEEWTYKQLDKRANQIAHALKMHGVGPEVRVGVLFERSLEMVASLYGTLKAGGAYVPFDPEYPEDRLAFLANDAGVEVLLTQRKWQNKLPPSQATALIVEDILGEAEDEEFVCDSFDPDRLAYVIYTSGSTGNPKGAMISHRNICNRILWMQEEYRLTASDTVLQKTPYSFDVSVWEFFWPLLVGTKLVIARAGGHKEPRYLADLIKEHKVTTIHFVPSMLSVFMEQVSAEECGNLRQVFCSGEALPYQLQEEFLSRFNAQLYNLYGPTEAAVDVTHWKCRRDYLKNIVPIGRPVANTQMYILDDHLQRVPVGTPGELYIGGVQVGRGYLNREELTAERFIPDPFRREGSIYKTGDLARYLPDGNIEYLGRNDDQVKILGVRIELGEIENALLNQEGVREAIVLAPNNNIGELSLVAYVVAEKDRRADIWEQLKGKLPFYMIPRLIFIDHVPVNHNGKADRKALAALGEGQSFDSEREWIEPRDSVEADLLHIWSQILDRTPISIDDHFFQLGGHSLAAVRLMSRISKHFDIELPLSAIIQHATIQELAVLIREGTHSVGQNSPVVAFTPSSSVQTPLFLIHPIGGNSFCYALLAEELKETFNVYALQSLGLDVNVEPQTNVEEMAASYIHTLRSIQPEGPYYIGGWSFGGVIAFEIARQLQAMNEQIGLLILLDSTAPLAISRTDEYFKGRLLQSFVRDLVGTLGSEMTRDQLKWLQSCQNTAELLSWLKENSFLPHDIEQKTVDHLYHIFRINSEAESMYAPNCHLDVPALLIAANDGDGDAALELSIEWKQLIHHPLRTVSMLGNHYSILSQSNVAVAAAEIKSMCRALSTEQLMSRR